MWPIMKALPFSRFFSCLVLAGALLLPEESSAISLFGGERKRLYEEAVAAVQAGDLAGEQGRELAQLQHYRTAQAKMRELTRNDPEYRRDEVAELWRQAGEKSAAVADKIRSGEIAVPDPDQILAAREGGFVSLEQMETKQASEPDTPSFRPQPPEVLLRTTPTPEERAAAAEAALAASAPAAGNMATDDSMANPLFADDEEPHTPAQPSVSVAVTPIDESSETANFPKEDRLRVLVIRDWLANNKAADAVLFLESVLDHEGTAATVTTRLLYARALLACNNITAADRVLSELPRSAASDPAVRSLRAATAIRKENYPEALLELEKLWVESGRTYADALMNMTYVQFLMDPVQGRNDCIQQYKLAVERGAARDRSFERALRIEVVE